MPNRPLLSIVIPTKNRVHTAIVSIQTQLLIFNDEIELIAHDCSNTDDLEKEARKIHDDRFKFRHVQKPLSMTQNWNMAMELVSGEYVIYIGDDDSVLPYVMDIVKWAKHNNIEAVSALRPIQYFWDDYPEKEKAGRFFLHDFDGKIFYPEPQKEFYRYVRDAIPKNYSFMPNIYGGLIRYDLLETVFSKTGHFFDSILVDYYLSLVMLYNINKYAVIDFPFYISGHCKSANSGDKRIFKKGINHVKEYNVVWPPVIPKPFRSHLGGYLNAKYVAFKNLGRDDLIKELDYASVYAITMIEEPKYMIQELLRQYQRSLRIVGLHVARGWVFLVLAILRTVFGRVFIKIRTHFFSGKPSFQFSSSATDIQQANIKLVEYLKDCSPTLQAVLKGKGTK